MASDVDIIVLSRDDQPLRKAVASALANQHGVRLHVHRIIGMPQPHDANRWQYIARARNRGVQMGRAPWIMFVDDDVVLDAYCVRHLIEQLERQPVFGALAADYLREAPFGGPSRHVAMGATLFRRRALANIRFRWEQGRCECQCCCDDLRAAGWLIAYSGAAKAWHLPGRGPQPHTAPASRPLAGQSLRPRILTAFNRAHVAPFRRRFLHSLRRAGNDEFVTAVAYGLHRRHSKSLRSLHHVDVAAFPPSRFIPARNRLRDFQEVLARWHPDTPVAYWDAGDIWFQTSLRPLWELVRQHPQQLLVVREALSHPRNRAVANWTLSIHHRRSRQAAFALLASRPFFNAGFAAGTARVLLRYLRYAHRLRESGRMRGTRNKGDQTAFNLYCHGNPRAYKEIDRGWNFCLFGLPPGMIRRRSDGHVSSVDGTPVYVIHGNGGTFNRLLPAR